MICLIQADIINPGQGPVAIRLPASGTLQAVDKVTLMLRAPENAESMVVEDAVIFGCYEPSKFR